jgi:hypothetical protein
MHSRAQVAAGSDTRVEIQVWPLPDAVAVGEPCTLFAGAKSAAGHNLQGGTIEICDHSGAVMASGKLGVTPWPETNALYWTELTLAAPLAVGPHSWSARFIATDIQPPHASASCEFALVTVAPAVHTLKVKVLDPTAAIAIEDAIVRWGAFRTLTDARGQAELRVPKGAHDLIVWKSGYDAPVKSVAIDQDTAVVIAVAPVPEENPDDAWKM